MIPEIQTILVPKGAEYQAVCRGLRSVPSPPTVFPIPIGSTALVPYLTTLKESRCLNKGQNVLVIGLCGGLAPSLAVGTPVLYKTCASLVGNNQTHPLLTCDHPLITSIQTTLSNSIRLVSAITSDRVICLAREKQQVFQQTEAEVVDMEGYTLLSLLTDAEISTVTLRVVSDDCQRDLPNLSQAISSNGSLKPLALTKAMLSNPIAAARLIRSSTKSLKILQTLTGSLFS